MRIWHSSVTLACGSDGVPLLDICRCQHVCQYWHVSHIMVDTVSQGTFAYLLNCKLTILQDLPYPHHDTGLGISSISIALVSPLSRKPHLLCNNAWATTGDSVRGNCFQCSERTRRRLLDQLHDMRRVHVPAHDTKAATRHAAPRCGEYNCSSP